MDEPSLELLLREHLSAELNGQLGRSAAAFLRHTGQASGAAPTAQTAEVPAPLRLADAPAVAPESLSSRFGRFGRFGASGNVGGRFNGWLLGLAGAALAASIAALWAAPAAFRGGAPVIRVRGTSPAHPTTPAEQVAQADPGQLPAPSPGQPTIRWLSNRAWDEGTVVLDDPGSDQPEHLVPARKIRQQQWEQTQWYDPARRARVEMTVPRQNVKFVDMDTY